MFEMEQRMRGKRQEILRALRNAGRRGLTNVELSKIALRYGGYLGKLYELGYEIKKEHLGNGLFNYVLVKEPEVERTEIPKAVDYLLEEVALRGEVTAEELGQLIENLGVTVRYKAGTHQKTA
jgi:hypothetical protein